MRRDVRVPNESDAFVFTSEAHRGRGLMPGEDAWMAAVAAHDLFAIVVESEDPANVRVVVDEPLTAEEQSQWVGRAVGGLRVADGRLALCGGAAYVIDQGDWAAEYARLVEVPAGAYNVTLYCYASAPNGQWCLEQAGNEEALGTWFRRSRPGEEMPSWLHNRCVHDPDNDPAHRAKWKRAEEKVGGEVVDFLLHLESVSHPRQTATLDHGFVEAVDCRIPREFPTGIAVDESAADAAASAPVAEAAVRPAPSAGYEPVPLKDGAVAIPVAKIVRAARLAWLCHPYTLPALSITSNSKINLDEVEGVSVQRAGRDVQVTFEDNGQPAAAEDTMVALGKQLGDLADGSIALDFARRGKAHGDRPIGLLKFHGTVTGGQWRIESTFPAMDAGVLREALAVAEAVEIPRRFIARDDAEAQRIEERLMRHAPEFFHSNPLQRNGSELSVRRDPAALWQIAARAFWLRYADSFPLQDLDVNPPG